MSAHNRPHLIEQINRLDCTATLWQVDIRPKKSKRSNPQNDRMWQFFTDLADYIGYEKHEVEQLKEMVTMKVSPVWKVLPDGVKVPTPPRTSKMNTKEHTELMDAVERYVAGWGFVWEAHE